MSVKNTNSLFKEKLKSIDKFAIWITNKVGTIGFFFGIFIWTATWLSWNIFAPEQMRYDPYPAFVLWLFISNMIQIFLMPLIMVGQNMQGKHSELRAENDFKINVKAEREIEELRDEVKELKQLLQKLVDENYSISKK